MSESSSCSSCCNCSSCSQPVEIACVDFGEAIRAVKQGKRIKRLGWNGKDQYISLGTAFTYEDKSGVHEAQHQTSGTAALVFHGTIGTQVGWLASQSDMLSEDWIILD